MNRMTMAAVALALAGCANFDQLENDALDAGRVAGMSGGSAGGTSGGSAGGTSGGSAGGTSGGSAGGTSGGSAGGTSGGSAGGMSGGSAGGMGGGSAGGASPPPTAWSGMQFRSRPTTSYAIAATVNGLFVEAFAEDGGQTTVMASGVMLNQSPIQSTVGPVDLDARFGMATAVLGDTLHIFALGTWTQPATTGVAGRLLTAPLYRRAPSEPMIALYSFAFASGPSVSTYTSFSGVFSSTGMALTLNFGDPSNLRVRPDVAGQYGTIVSDTFYARIENAAPTVQTTTRLLVASSETQQSIVAGFESAPTRAALFWLPNGAVSLPLSSPNFRLDMRDRLDGGMPTSAIATNGTRHAAIIGPAGSADEWSFGPSRVRPAEGDWLVVVFGSTPSSFISLGSAATPPFGLAFEAGDGGSGLFVMANCRADGGICAQPGSVVGFLPQP